MSVIYCVWNHLHSWLLSTGLTILSHRCSESLVPVQEGSRNVYASWASLFWAAQFLILLSQLTSSPCVDVITDAAWSPSCLEKKTPPCVSFCWHLAALVTKWDQLPFLLAFSFFIKEKPNSLETVHWLVLALQILQICFFPFSFLKRNKPSGILPRTALKKCSCAIGLRLPMPLLTFNKTFQTRVPCRASPVVISVVAFYTIHGNRCHRFFCQHICEETNDEQQPQKRGHIMTSRENYSCKSTDTCWKQHVK